MIGSSARLMQEDTAAVARRPSGIANLTSRLRDAFPADAIQDSAGGAAPASLSQAAFISRCVVLQAVGGALLVGLWLAGLAEKPFEGDTGYLCGVIAAMAVAGVACVFMQRWRDVQWIATHVVRIGLLGTVVGLIVAFSAAQTGDTTDPSQIKPMIAAVVSGMYVSLYATLLGIATNLWLKINMRVLGQIDG
jgi:hypothetical protein